MTKYTPNILLILFTYHPSDEVTQPKYAKIREAELEVLGDDTIGDPGALAHPFMRDPGEVPSFAAVSACMRDLAQRLVDVTPEEAHTDIVDLCIEARMWANKGLPKLDRCCLALARTAVERACMVANAAVALHRAFQLSTNRAQEELETRAVQELLFKLPAADPASFTQADIETMTMGVDFAAPASTWVQEARDNVLGEPVAVTDPGTDKEDPGPA